MYLITLLKSGVRLLVEILITVCKLMSVNEHLYLLLLIFKQEKLCSQIYVDPNVENKSWFKADFSVLAGHKKTLSGPQFAHPCPSAIE
jgi:hypothetical protein